MIQNIMHMGNNEFIEDSNFKNEAVYKIVVQGEVGQEWSGRLSNMKITIDKRAGKKKHSSLVGKISDQAALSSVLNILYDLHMTVVSVELLHG